jgi:hypothetical protein
VALGTLNAIVVCGADRSQEVGTGGTSGTYVTGTAAYETARAPCIRGLRIPVSGVVDMIAEGSTSVRRLERNCEGTVVDSVGVNA